MRNLGLDILRLVAVVLVLGRHADLAPDAPALLKTWKVGGWVGVDLFFVLSGFLVSGLIFREHQEYGSCRLKRFMVRRWFKIYPPVVALVAFTIVLASLQGQPVSGWDVAGELGMMQNYAWLAFGGRHAGRLWDHTWSLAVEWHFYLLLAAAIFVMGRLHRGPKDEPFSWVPAAFAACALVCLALRILTAVRFASYNHTWFLFGTHVRLDSLMFGVLLSYLWHFRSLRRWAAAVPWPLFVAAGVLCFAPAFMFPLEDHKAISVFGVVLLYLGSGLLLLAAVRLESSRSRFLLLLGLLGGASYSIYLWHLPLAQFGWPCVRGKAGEGSLATYLLFYMGGALLLGLVMNKVVEVPSLWMRQRLFPSGTRPLIGTWSRRGAPPLSSRPS